MKRTPPSSQKRILDLNNPGDAREYIWIWETTGELTLQDGETAYSLEDADAIAIARAIFLKCDTRQPTETHQ